MLTSNAALTTTGNHERIQIIIEPCGFSFLTIHLAYYSYELLNHNGEKPFGTGFYENTINVNPFRAAYFHIVTELHTKARQLAAKSFLARQIRDISPKRELCIIWIKGL